MTRRPKERGIALILLMVVIIIATLIGIWGLSSSRIGIMKAGNKAAQTKLQLLAEQGLQKALRRIQEISDCCAATCPCKLVDSVGKIIDGDEGIRTVYFLHGKPLDAGDPEFLCEPLASGELASCDSPACSDLFNTNDGFDDINENVVCNFLGDTLEDTQVILVRKTDLQATPKETDAIFLVNSIARDKTDRRQIVQGVVVLPYDATTGVALLEPYLATSSKSAD